MRTPSADLLLLVDAARTHGDTIANLGFVPPIRVKQAPDPPDPGGQEEEPLLYLLGNCEALRSEKALLGWLDRIQAADGAPVAFLLPRPGIEWCAAVTHPQCCGLVPAAPALLAEGMERVVQRARRAQSRHWGRGALRRVRLCWTLTTREAADTERTWLLLESSLAVHLGPSPDLSALGMAFTEALTNAVEHGNLELESALKDEVGGLVPFFEERARRLENPHYNRRRIFLMAELRGTRLRVRIGNEGRPCEPKALAPQAASDAPPPHGLGLRMIHSLVGRFVISSDGRSSTIFHRLSQRGPRSGRRRPAPERGNHPVWPTD